MYAYRVDHIEKLFSKLLCSECFIYYKNQLVAHVLSSQQSLTRRVLLLLVKVASHCSVQRKGTQSQATGIWTRINIYIFLYYMILFKNLLAPLSQSFQTRIMLIWKFGKRSLWQCSVQLKVIQFPCTGMLFHIIDGYKYTTNLSKVL